MKRVKIYYVLRLLISALFGIAVGVGILWADAYAIEVFDVLLIAYGLIAVLFNLPSFLISLRAVAGKEKWEWINLASAFVSICFGFSFMLVPRAAAALPFVLGAYVIVVPLVRIVLVAEHAKQFRLELPKVLFGLFLLIVTVTESEDTLFFALGITSIVISVLYLLKRFLDYPKKFRSYEERFNK